MGWYFPRSIRLGPLCVNLSNSGLGASAGVKGARVGVDATGKPCVAGERGGLYFRERIPTSTGAGLLWPILTIIAGLLVGLVILGSF
jgi:hypothetical protein